MPALTNKNYFNYGGQGPLPSKSLNAITNSWHKIQELGPFTNDVWPYITNETNKTRQIFADLCGVPNRRLALTENVTSGCVLPLWGLPITERDRILISDSEHPGVVAACYELARRLNLLIDIFPTQQINSYEINDQIILTEFEKALKAKTRLVVISHLLWNTGQIMPVQKISERLLSHPNKPFLLVDGAQSFSHIPIKEAAASADIFAFTGHKWAFGPEGLGGVAISERVLSESSPTLIGWKSLKSENCNFDNEKNIFHEDSRRFEIATTCIPLMAGLRCSIDLIEKEGKVLDRLETIKAHSLNLWDNLSKIKNIEPIIKQHPPGGIVSFKIKSNQSHNKIIKILSKKKVFIRGIDNPRCLRACVHVTTEPEEIEFLCRSIRDIN